MLHQSEFQSDSPTFPSALLSGPCCTNVTSNESLSPQVVRAFLTGRMSGIGDGLHHLELWGYRLEAVQLAADEFDYAVSSLKDDLRSGIRLAKLYELLTGGAGSACALQLSWTLLALFCEGECSHL